MFLRNDRPTVTAMLKSDTPDGLISEINEIKKIGTDAFGFQIDYLKHEYRNKDVYKLLFSEMGAPCYVTDYRAGNKGVSDEKLAEGLLEAGACGGSLLDIPGGMFDAQNGEFSENPDAVKKQKELIGKVHSLGCGALMSSHIFDKFVPENEIVKIAKCHEERGADIAKIVARADNADELDRCLALTIRLKHELGIPFLFLINGNACRIHRIVNPLLGSCMYLAQLKKTAENQPLLTEVNDIMKMCRY